MAEKEFRRTDRHLGRLEQVFITLGKLLRMFFYQNDWKLLPMSIIIACLATLVVRNDMFVTMEGSIKGALALTCVAIWNGAFNSIQVICRERDIVKREHRSGMHISSYIVAHMIYQALLCAIQAGLTVYACRLMGIKIPREGLVSRWMIVDLGVTVFLLSYAADMFALWMSSLVRSTTTAMSIMPFFLIAQLVFSGGIFVLPEWSEPISNAMISNAGVKCIAAQCDYNNLPMVSGWNIIEKMKDSVVTGEVTLGDLLEQAGEQEIKDMLTYKTAQVSKKDDYEHTKETVTRYWRRLALFMIVFAALAVISLEFVDKDKR